MVEVIWKPDTSVKKITLDKQVEYQKAKFEALRVPIIKRYHQSGVRQQYPLFNSISEFQTSSRSKGFVVGLVIDQTQKQKYRILKVIDSLSFINVHLDNSVDKGPIVEGVQLGLFLKKSQKTSKTRTHNRLQKVIGETKVKLSYTLEDYLYPGFDSIQWENQSTSKVLVISDIHVGNMTFCKQNFISLMHKASSDPRIKYVILNGDITDGIEVYPAQKKDLNIQSYIQQYETLASYLQILRQDISIIVAPGNHDYVGKIEPQSFSEEVESIFRSRLKNVHFGPNPGYYCIDGVYFYLTHGTSYNSILRCIESFDYSRCAEVTQYLAKVRNVSPIRKAVAISPNPTLNHIIPQKVNVICSGHMHSQQVKVYGPNRLLVATGAWQNLTPYMDLLGIKPDVSSAVVVDLSQFNKYQQWDLKDETTDRNSYHVALIQKDFN